MQDEFNSNSWGHFWLILWAIAILTDADRREEERRKKQQREKLIVEEERRKLALRRAQPFTP